MKAAGADNRAIANLFGHSDTRSALPDAEVQTSVMRNALGKRKSDSL